MKVWVDADATPRGVKEIVFRAAKRLELDTILVANQRLQTPANNPFVRTIRVEGGPDVADDYIAEQAQPGDLAITADIPLASRLVEKEVVAIDPRGQEYTAETIGERLSIRDFMDQLRSTGVETGGPKPYSDGDKRAFADAFDRTLTRMVNARL
ncbi:MAG: YaiI/YqxD family protein [Longimicrobiales bacterium]